MEQLSISLLSISPISSMCPHCSSHLSTPAYCWNQCFLVLFSSHPVILTSGLTVCILQKQMFITDCKISSVMSNFKYLFFLSLGQFCRSPKSAICSWPSVIEHISARATAVPSTWTQLLCCTLHVSVQHCSTSSCQFKLNKHSATAPSCIEYCHSCATCCTELPSSRTAAYHSKHFDFQLARPADFQYLCRLHSTTGSVCSSSAST